MDRIRISRTVAGERGSRSACSVAAVAVELEHELEGPHNPTHIEEDQGPCTSKRNQIVQEIPKQ